MLDNIFDLKIIYDILIAAVPALICITVHELSHGLAANALGDGTAKRMGRLTLNPVRHIDLIGLLMIVIIGFGWAKPVPVDMNSFKHPKWYMAITAAAGPLSNLLLALITAFVFMMLPFPYGGISPFYMAFLGYTGELPLITLIIHRLLILNVFLAVFNLLPIPPLDGSKVLFSLLPEKTYYKLMMYERYGMIFLLILIFSGRFLPFDLFGKLVQEPAMTLLLRIGELAQNAVN